MPTGTEIVHYDITHQMVEEFMLLANETVAKHLAKQGKELTYRIHEEPAKESLREFAALVEAFGYKLSQDPTPQEIQQFFVSIEDSPFIQYLSTCYIRSMRLACYSADNIGHYGLSLEHYCHFTSPIRRYVDTVAHRLLFEKGYDKKIIEQICIDASERERISARAENSVKQLKKLRLIDHWLKEDQYRQFEAVVTRVKPFGIYFDILELMYEGFLHISELDNDYFVFDDKRLLLFGRHNGFTYRAGDTLHVLCKRIDFILQEATWELVNTSSKKVHKNKRERKRS
jgi:ribonuclease R